MIHTDGKQTVANAPVRPRKQEQRSCVACGRPSGSSRWCSTSCFVAEDGIPYEWLDDADRYEAVA